MCNSFAHGKEDRMKEKNEILKMLEDGFTQNHEEIERKKRQRQEVIEEEAKKIAEWIVNECQKLDDDTEFRIIVSKEPWQRNYIANLKIETDDVLTEQAFNKCYCSKEEDIKLAVDTVKYIQKISDESKWITMETVDIVDSGTREKNSEEELYAVKVKISWER